MESASPAVSPNTATTVLASSRLAALSARRESDETAARETAVAGLRSAASGTTGSARALGVGVEAAGAGASVTGFWEPRQATTNVRRAAVRARRIEQGAAGNTRTLRRQSEPAHGG
jgi:hypothetical protein